MNGPVHPPRAVLLFTTCDRHGLPAQGENPCCNGAGPGVRVDPPRAAAQDRGYETWRTDPLLPGPFWAQGARRAMAATDFEKAIT